MNSGNGELPNYAQALRRCEREERYAWALNERKEEKIEKTFISLIILLISSFLSCDAVSSSQSKEETASLSCPAPEPQSIKKASGKLTASSGMLDWKVLTVNPLNEEVTVHTSRSPSRLSAQCLDYNQQD